MVLFVLVGLLGFAALPAQAGGPTSVLLASPTLQKAAALYNAGGDYTRLADAVDLEGAVVADSKVPARLGIGPGSGAINLTWLMHDVWIWRVDRVQIEPDGKVWLNTTIADSGGNLAVEGDGVWHAAPQPKELVALLTKLGVWDGVGSKKAQPDNAIVTGGSGAVGGGGDDAAPPAADTTTPVASTSPTPWLFAAIALLGVGVGFAVRPGLALAARFRGRHPKQQLIDA
ncbi:hypothetical protein [Tenggerimyces flavus]|uniref:hypothetical protein n=1 Tax=Tenggerimyces flavus TaxID=1708749 RepID=UPI00196096D1|nr:hypothetical protein [Tenggerimyces flavus]